jgi:hypothetical protein
MKLSVPERLWRQATGRVAHAWTRNHWIISHRRGSQVQPAQDASWAEAAVVTSAVNLLPSTAVARVGPARRQRAAESEWAWQGPWSPASMIAIAAVILPRLQSPLQ